MTGIAFSRLQLAAALLEYDNDSESPELFRSAKDSAIFSHLRQAKPRIEKTTDLLGVNLPNDTGSNSDSVAGTRKSLASVDAFQNLFLSEEPKNVDSEYNSDEEFEVNLSSWGLDSFLQNEKGSKGKGKAKLNYQRGGHNKQQHPRGRTMSLGDIDTLTKTSKAADSGNARLSEHIRRRSVFSLDDTFSTEQMGNSSSLPNEHHKDTIPFPTSSSSAPNYNHHPGDPSNEYLHSTMTTPGRTHRYSNATIGTLTNNVGADEPNPFIIRPPSPSRSSRFDPKVISHNRTLSVATNLSANTRHIFDEENHPGEIEPSAASIGHRRPERIRHISRTSMATQNLIDDVPPPSINDVLEYGGRRFTRSELMRPKVLIMPSPLQDATLPQSPVKTRDGFHVSTDGPPLPPEARSSRPISTSQFLTPTNLPLAVSNSFTPNPRLNLTTSQLLFRNSLVVGGQRDVSFNDIDGNMSRALVDGEQVPFEEQNIELDDDSKELTPGEVEGGGKKPQRLPGKLYGRSLMDELEVRKAEMHNKRRVFTGDDRPSMMNRSSIRYSTLVDPASLLEKSNLSRTDSFSPALAQSVQQRGLLNDSPFLKFDGQDGNNNVGSLGNVPKTRSVFGVDTLWERELHRLEQLKLVELEENMMSKETEVLKSRKVMKKKEKKKGKGKRKEEVGKLSESASPPEPDSFPQKASLPPILPDIFQPRAKDEVVAGSDDGSSISDIQAPSDKMATKVDMRGWISDEEQPTEPLRVTGVGPRYPHRNYQPPEQQAEDSDEDIPLAATIHRFNATAVTNQSVDGDSDEEKPLSTLIGLSTKEAAKEVPQLLSPSNLLQDDDNEPLGLRASKYILTSGDDDDRPLALHPEHQRKTQILSQQQQMLFQSQFGNTMAYGMHPAINPIYTNFGLPLQHDISPLLFPSAYNVQTPAQDSGKFGRVDRWRRDVADEKQATAGVGVQ